MKRVKQAKVPSYCIVPLSGAYVTNDVIKIKIKSE